MIKIGKILCQKNVITEIRKKVKIKNLQHYLIHIFLLHFFLYRGN